MPQWPLIDASHHRSCFFCVYCPSVPPQGTFPLLDSEQLHLQCTSRGYSKRLLTSPLLGSHFVTTFARRSHSPTHSPIGYHPDKNKAAGAHDKFLLVAKAYKVLSRPNSRDDYDVELEMGGGDRAASSVYNEDMDLYSALNVFSDIFDTAGDGRFVQQDGKTDWAKVLEQASAKFTGADGELDVSSLGRSIMNVMQQFAGGSGVSADGGGWSDIGQTVSGTLRQVLSSDEAPTSKTRSRKR